MLHYFEDPDAANLDVQLNMAIGQGYVPETCLLGGAIVLGLVADQKDPCKGCEGPRDLCHGREK